MCLQVFLFKQKTAYELRISDWISDVCSSDLRKVGDCFCVVTPWRRTSSGNRASAWLTRFCTRTVASSASVPGRKVTVICSTPSEPATDLVRSEEHTSELQSLMRISYAVFCLKKKKKRKQ